MKATKKDIGEECVLNDNSYCIDLFTKKEGFVSRKLGTICSRPIKLTFTPSHRRSQPIIREFVVVLYKGEFYRVLNSFSRIGKRTK